MPKKIRQAYLEVTKNINRIRAVLFIITLLSVSVATLSYYVQPVKAQPAPTITYDGTNIIVENGTTHNLFMDIWTAHEANGTWNVMNNTCDRQFKFWCSIQIINSTVSDINKQVIFETYPFSTISIEYDSSSYVRFGNATDVTNKIGSNGIDLWSLESALNVQFIRCSVSTFPSGCGVELYGCSFNYPDTSSFGSIGYYVSYNGGNAPIWNCLLRNTNIAFSKVDISEVEMIGTGSGSGSYRFQSGSTVKDLQITNWGYGMYFPTGTFELRDIELLNNTDDFRILGNGELNCTDFTADWTFSFHSRSNMIVYRKYSFDLRAIYEDQTPLANCNVSLTDVHGTELFNIQTFANGTIPTQTVTYAYYQRTTGDTPNLESPHTLRVFKEGIRMYKSVFNITEKMKFLLTLTARGWHTGTEGITFQPNSIPKVKTSYSEYTFYFRYEEYQLGLRPFAIYNNETWKMKDIVPFLKSKGATYDWAFRILKDVIHYGFNVTGIPEEIAANLNYLGFKVVEYNFPLKAIECQIIQKEPYNVTILSIPKINLEFSFEDLQERGYSVIFVNKTCLLIGNVNQTDLDIDPIVYSSPIITITGFTEGSPCDFQDVCDVNDANAWDVVDAIGEGQFFFEAKIVLGDCSTETWFADTEKTVIFSEDLSGNTIKIEDNATLRFGELIVSAERRTRKGVTMITLKAASHYPIYMHSGASLDPPRLMLYSSTIRAADTDARISLSGEVEIYESIIDQAIVLIETDRAQDSYDFYRLNIKGADYAIWSYSSSALMNDLLVHSSSYGIRFDGSVSGTVNNTVFRNNTRLLLAYYLTANCYLNDVTADNWDLTFLASSGEIYRRYSFDLTVIFQNGSYAQNANVTVSNNYLGTSDSWLTNSIGQIPSQVYSMGHYNDTADDIIYSYNPYNISISLEGFQTNTFLYNHTKTTDLTLALVATAPEEVAPFRVDLLLFMTCLLFTSLYEYSNLTKRDLVWSGIVCSICWIVLSLVWFVLSGTVYVIALLFSGVGIFYIVRWMIDLVNNSRSSRSLGEESSAIRSL